MTESKYKEFRGWFDQRLDDAIAAAEAQENAAKLNSEGKIIPNFHIRVHSSYALEHILGIMEMCH